MVGMCANPYCGEPFRYLRQGKLFLLDVPRLEPNSGKPQPASSRGRERFWLCPHCCGALTVVVDDNGDVVLADVPGGRRIVLLRAVA